MSNKNNDAVGYKNPPKSTRFQAGVSGNPRGRPKATPTLMEVMVDELSQLVHFDDGAQKISNARAICKSLVRDARTGNLRAANLVLNFCAKALGDVGETQREMATAHDADILDEYISRELRRRTREADVAREASGSTEDTRQLQDDAKPNHQRKEMEK